MSISREDLDRRVMALLIRRPAHSPWSRWARRFALHIDSTEASAEPFSDPDGPPTARMAWACCLWLDAQAQDPRSAALSLAEADLFSAAALAADLREDEEVDP